MALQHMTHEELQQFVTHLDQALYNHTQWHKELIRTLICRLPCDQHDIKAEPHKECRFGQWYYSRQKEEDIMQHPGFIAIGDAHMRMHQLASQLLIKINEQSSITPLEYDHFSNALEQLRLELTALKYELESLLYNRDPLTGAINRINMLPLLRERQEVIRRTGQTSCIAMLDIDFFKKINDTYGHVIGDQVLVLLTGCIIEHLRPYDKIFRYGGEEFLLCIQDTDLPVCQEILERLRHDIEALDMDVKLDKPIRITVSIGLTRLSPTLPIEENIVFADQALYKAKNSGRNRIEILQCP